MMLVVVSPYVTTAANIKQNVLKTSEVPRLIFHNLTQKVPTKAQAIFGMKCPRCHRGDLFPTATFSFQQPFEMYDRCPVCDQNYSPEPGFYYGSMFISYILSGFFCLGFAFIGVFLIGWSIGTTFTWLILICLVGFVWTFRISRSIWIHINVRRDRKFDPENRSA